MNEGKICWNIFELRRLPGACVSHVRRWQDQLVSGSRMVCNSVYAAGQVSLLHVFTASQLCRQAMHHDQAHHPLLCHNMLQSYTCTSEPPQPSQTQVIPAQRWIWFLWACRHSSDEITPEMQNKTCNSRLIEWCLMQPDEIIFEAAADQGIYGNKAASKLCTVYGTTA